MMEFLFKVMQLANVLGGALLLRSAVPHLWRAWLGKKVRVDVPMWIIAIGAAIGAAIPILTFSKRIMDGAVNWLGGELMPYTSTVSMILLFALLAWFEHLMRRGYHEEEPPLYSSTWTGLLTDWREQHILFALILAISIVGTTAETIWM